MNRSSVLFAYATRIAAHDSAPMTVVARRRGADIGGVAEPIVH